MIENIIDQENIKEFLDIEGGSILSSDLNSRIYTADEIDKSFMNIISNVSETNNDIMNMNNILNGLAVDDTLDNDMMIVVLQDIIRKFGGTVTTNGKFEFEITDEDLASGPIVVKVKQPPLEI